MMIYLRASGVDTTHCRFLKDGLVHLCTQHNINYIMTTQNIIPGWCGKPKDIPQILFERGYMDSKLVTTPRMMRYSKDGKKKYVNGKTKEMKDEYKHYSLSYSLGCCPTFRDDKTDLEQLYDDISIVNGRSDILYTPKFHCKLDGEGIEYLWGAPKRFYRHQPINKKRSVVDFERLVKLSLLMVTLAMSRRFLAKARGYMLIYTHNELSEEDTIVEWTFKKNEKIHKQYCIHRDANCIDGKFIEKLMRDIIGI